MQETQSFSQLIRTYHSKNDKSVNILRCLEILKTSSIVQDHSLLFSSLQQYLENEKNNLQNSNSEEIQTFYLKASPFTWFIKGFENPELYAEVNSKLFEEYAKYNQKGVRILDVGAGSGLGCCGAIKQFLREYPTKLHIDVVEPSDNLSTMCIEEFAKINHSVNSSENRSTESELDRLSYFISSMSMETYVTSNELSNQHWDVIQSSFALHNIKPEDRQKLFKWAITRSENLFIIEFDAKDKFSSYYPAGSEELPCIDESFAEFVHNKYESALKKFYDQGGFTESDDLTTTESRELSNFVIQEFLMPIMLDYFNPDQQKSTFEQSIDAWKNELKCAGYNNISTNLVYRYWWADCYIIKAACS